MNCNMAELLVSSFGHVQLFDRDEFPTVITWRLAIHHNLPFDGVTLSYLIFRITTLLLSVEC